MTLATQGRPAEILLVEDSPTDVLMTRKALERATLASNLSVVDDGEKALDFLHRRGDYADVPRPDIVLLDLNLPRLGGREVLADIKTDPELKVIPVVVLTTSRADEDIINAYRLHANSYIAKPVDFTAFVEVLRVVEQFWFAIVTLPNFQGATLLPA